MKIIISPAKKLNMNSSTYDSKMSYEFLSESKSLISELKLLDKKKIKDLMSISDSLVDLNFDRFQKWDDNLKPTYKALDLFAGAVFEAMQINDFTEEDRIFAQENLRIISGLYGVLAPEDLILPYRLEMGTKLKTSRGNNLYSFWGDKLNQYISGQIKDSFLVNLASDEYSKSLKLNKLSENIVTPVFKDFKNGKLKVISFYAKKARGYMCNYIIKNRIAKIDDLKLFSENGYSFQEEKEGYLIFTR
tara:strand:- start:2481 stop:3221 length:741 start_codon:yes stop_codon:yes gene_type:complete